MHDPLLVIGIVLAFAILLLVLTFSLASVMVFLGAFLNEKEAELHDNIYTDTGDKD